jgi:hypothetical protein
MHNSLQILTAARAMFGMGFKSSNSLLMKC